MDEDNQAMSKHSKITIIEMIILVIGFCLLMINFIRCFSGRCPESSSETVDGIKVSFWSQHSRYEIGETILVRATIKNVSGLVANINAENEPAFDITYQNLSGEARRWSDQNPQLASPQITLKPNEELTIEMEYISKQTDIFLFTAKARTPQNSGFYVDFRIDVGSTGMLNDIPLP